jgi:hypothetical protein
MGAWDQLNPSRSHPDLDRYSQAAMACPIPQGAAPSSTRDQSARTRELDRNARRSIRGSAR